MAVIGSLICSTATIFAHRVGWLLFLGLFVLGGGTTSALVSRFVATEKIDADKHKASAIGIVLTGSALGSAIGPNIYGFISKADTPSISLTFIGSALVFALGLIPLTLERRKDYSSRLTAHPTSHKGRKIIWNPSYVAIFSLAIISHSAMISLMTMAPIYTDHLYGPTGSGFVMTAHLLGMYAFSPLVSFLFNRVGSKITVAIGVFIFAVSISILIFFHDSLTFFIMGLFGVGLGWSIGIITSSSLISQVSDLEQRIALQGRLDISINIAAGVSSICSGIAVAALGYPGLAVGVFFAICLATLTLIIFQRTNCGQHSS